MMWGAAVVIFRESLEAALILGIVAASTRQVQGRNGALGLGVLFGLLGAGVLALVMRELADLADGMGQELFNASVLGVAVLMLAWHHIWMQSHGAELAKQAKKVGKAVTEGAAGLSAIVVLIALTVLREGGESVLFLQGIASAGGANALSMMWGALLGLAAGAVLGFVLYLGLVRVPLKWFFSVTGAMLVLLASGLASQMARFLVQADYLPALRDSLWDTSWLLSSDSVSGSIMKVLVGYDASPNGMQVVFYVSALLAITGAAVWVRRDLPQRHGNASSVE